MASLKFLLIAALGAASILGGICVGAELVCHFGDQTLPTTVLAAVLALFPCAVASILAGVEYRGKNRGIAIVCLYFAMMLGLLCGSDCLARGDYPFLLLIFFGLSGPIGCVLAIVSFFCFAAGSGIGKTCGAKKAPRALWLCAAALFAAQIIFACLSAEYFIFLQNECLARSVAA